MELEKHLLNATGYNYPLQDFRVETLVPQDCAWCHSSEVDRRETE